MKTLNALLFASVALSVVGFAGCDVLVDSHSRHDRVYVQEQPQYVQAQPVYVEQQPTYVIVQQAPPPIIVERRPQAPSTAHIWIEGAWHWDGNRYAWQAGQYQLPPEPDAVWVSARYVKSSDGYHYTAGQWSKPAKDNGRGNGRGRGNQN